MLESLQQIDNQIFMALQAPHGNALGLFMWLFTDRLIWVPMYVMMLWALWRTLGWRCAIIYCVGIALAVACADQLCASLLRPLVERMRPSNPQNPFSQLVAVYQGYRGGAYGFPSCHAANTAVVCTFVSLLMRDRRLTITLVVWVLLTCYTRIYLGVHYPGDLFVGAIVGVAVAYICYACCRALCRKYAIALRHTEHPSKTLKPGGRLRYSDQVIGVFLIIVVSLIIIALTSYHA